VAQFRLTVRAELDLLDIADYTLQTWGVEQSVRYLDRLEERCHFLAERPQLGQRCDHIRPGLRRSKQDKHVIFYRYEGDDILIVRILHHRMLPGLHLLDDHE
jgi:toxin ParE1/3/4